VNIPSALLDLLNPEKETRTRGYWSIDNVVVVQGALYQGAMFAVPFVIELLRNDIAGATEAYNLLFEVANGVSDSRNRVRYAIREAPFLFYVPVEVGGIAEPLCVACRGAVLRGLPSYLDDLKSGGAQRKAGALALVSSFTEHRFLVRSALKELLASEIDPGFRTQIAEAQAELAR
jgi:hypothetical protein